jgi:hypothetical protein
MRTLLLLWLVLLTPAAMACEVRPVATVPVDMSTPNLVVHATIDGASVPLILDTGAERSVLDAVAAKRLGIARDEWVDTGMVGIGGVEHQRNALPRTIVLGGVALHPRSVAPGISLPVGHMALGAIGGEPIAGLLGTDLLAAFDLALDGPAHRLTLYDVRGCSGRFLPWSQPYDAIPTLRPVRDMLMVPARIDHRVMLALIDTGSASTLILAPGMYRLGLTEALLEDDQAASARGFGPGSLPAHLHRFDALTIGSDTTPDPRLWVGDGHVMPIVDLLLGADWLRQRVVWLSYATTQVFVARR